MRAMMLWVGLAAGVAPVPANTASGVATARTGGDAASVGTAAMGGDAVSIAAASVRSEAGIVAATLDADAADVAAAGIDIDIADIAATTVSGDPAKTAAQLDALARRRPGSAAAWLASARAWKALPERAAEAEAAYRAHLVLAPLAPRALYELASVQLARGDRAGALATLQRAASTRRIDLSGVGADPAFAALKDDPALERFGRWDESLAGPLVEGDLVLREWRGEAAGDQFGWIARGIGDVDRDGVQDFATSAPTARGGRGRVYVYSTRLGGLLWSRDGGEAAQSGTGVESAGDVDGNGTPDVVACGPGGAGGAWLLDGADGRMLHALAAPKGAGAFGNQCQGVGDVDADGAADVLVGAPGSQPGDPGHAYLYSGRSGALLHTFKGERAGDQFGSAVTGTAYAPVAGQRAEAGGGAPPARAGWLAIGAPRAGARNAGRVYLHAYAATNTRDVAPAPSPIVLEGDASSIAFGRMFLSVPGDVNGDGVPELYVSDWADATRGPGTGRVYLFDGATGKRLRAWTGEHPGEGFGTTQAVLGDVDGDGAADLAVGTWQYGRIAIGAGRVQIVSGRTGEALAALTSRVPGDTLGFDAVGLGDVDGDGAIDLLVTAAWSPVRGPQTGRVLLLRTGLPAPAR